MLIMLTWIWQCIYQLSVADEQTSSVRPSVCVSGAGMSGHSLMALTLQYRTDQLQPGVWWFVSVIVQLYVMLLVAVSTLSPACSALSRPRRHVELSSCTQTCGQAGRWSAADGKMADQNPYTWYYMMITGIHSTNPLKIYWHPWHSSATSRVCLHWSLQTVHAFCWEEYSVRSALGLFLSLARDFGMHFKTFSGILRAAVTVSARHSRHSYSLNTDYM